MIGWIISAAFRFCFMAFANDVISRHNPSNEMCRQLWPEKTKVRLFSHLNSSKRCFTRPSLLTRHSSLVLKVGVPYVTLRSHEHAYLVWHGSDRPKKV